MAEVPLPTPTQVPVPSTDIRNAVFAGAKLDEEVTGTGEFYTDRLGVQRLTNTGRTNLFNLSQQDRESRFNAFIQNSGYEVIGDYTAGPLTLTEYNQLIRYNNELYKLTAATDIPFTTAGNTDETWTSTDAAHFVSVGDAALRQNLGSIDPLLGGALVALPQGGTVNSSVLYLTPEQDGAKGDGIEDDTDAILSTINRALSRSVTATGIYVPVTIQLSSIYRITKSITVEGSRIRFSGLAGCGFFIDSAGSYTDSKVFLISGEGPEAAYVGQSGSLFENVCFLTTGKTLDLFHSVRNSSVSGDNGACLHNISNISARGFNRVFTHGSGGWGWTWVGCQFSGCTNLMNIVTASDTYERHSFFGCTWQNGGYAFVINNPDGRIYWHAGSIDYSDGLASIGAGFIEASGHNEWTARSLPLVTITGSNAFVKMSGTMFVRNNTTTQYYIFKQYQARQVFIDDVVFVTDGVNTSYGLISNYEVIKGNLAFTNDASKSIAYNSSDENMISGTIVNADYSLSSTASHSVSVVDGKITVTASASGVTSHLYIDIAVTGRTKLAFKMIASNTSSAGAISLNKSLLTLGKSQIANLSTSGTASWAANAASVPGGSVTVFDVPKQAGYFRLDFNVANLAAGTSFIIESLKLFTY
ncbi:pectate lyase family protein [Klebsiella oxytoca]|uniref:hypothetical protein n=1 Tax=Klebsiella oxytoca TaxID=571 RepID=UPI00195B9503|nr:hypothetical protein [Klebsiella oxytoca]QRS18658.1 hypothetical protein I6K64_12930 [Klebsiella oxytoca]